MTIHRVVLRRVPIMHSPRPVHLLAYAAVLVAAASAAILADAQDASDCTSTSTGFSFNAVQKSSPYKVRRRGAVVFGLVPHPCR